MIKLIGATALAVMLATPLLAQTAAPTPRAEEMFYTQHGDWRASKLIGVKVINAAGETIGDINNLLIDKEHRVAAVAIGVGGYLGMGERHVAVAFNALQLTRDANEQPQVHVNLTKEQIVAMPEWTWQPGTDQRRASKLIGSNVVNLAGDTVGDINELLIDKDGYVAAAVIGVGGFLSMGEHYSAISFNSLQVTRDPNSSNPLVRVRVTKEQLKASPEWKWQASKAN